MGGLFSSLADFFMDIFTSDPELRKIRKEMKDIHESLLQIRPPVFDKKEEMVLPGLATTFFNLYKLTIPIYDIFSKTISNPEKKIQEISQLYLIESFLLGDISARRLQFSYDNLKNRFFNAGDPSNELNKINSDFNSLLGDLRRQDHKSVNTALSEIMRLKEFVGHDFNGFFKKFGFDLQNISISNPKFNPVLGDNILPELLDLYFVLAPLQNTPNVFKGLSALLEKISPSKSQENIRKIEKLLNKIQTILDGPGSGKIFLYLIRAIRREPTFMPESSKDTADHFQNYMENLGSKFAADRDRSYREIKENSIKKEIDVLFPQMQLLSVQNYTSERNEILNNLGLPSLEYVKPIQILKSFLESVFKTYLQEQTKLFLVDAVFQDKEFGNKVGTLFFHLEKSILRLDNWDNDLVSEGKNTFSALEKFIKSKNTTGMVPQRIIENINKGAQEILENETNTIAQFAVKLQDILMDYKNPQPQNVPNIKGLGGKNNQYIFQGLINGYNKTVSFLKLMKNFIILKSPSNS